MCEILIHYNTVCVDSACCIIPVYGTVYTAGQSVWENKYRQLLAGGVAESFFYSVSSDQAN